MSSAPVSLPAYFGSKPKGMIRTDEVAKLLGVSSVTVHNWRRTKAEFPQVVAQIRYTNRGNLSNLYSTQAVLDWIAKRDTSSASVDKQRKELQASVKELREQLERLALALSKF